MKKYIHTCTSGNSRQTCSPISLARAPNNDGTSNVNQIGTGTTSKAIVANGIDRYRHLNSATIMFIMSSERQLYQLFSQQALCGSIVCEDRALCKLAKTTLRCHSTFIMELHFSILNKKNRILHNTKLFRLFIQHNLNAMQCNQ